VIYVLVKNAIWGVKSYRSSLFPSLECSFAAILLVVFCGRGSHKCHGSHNSAPTSVSCWNMIFSSLYRGLLAINDLRALPAPLYSKYLHTDTTSIRTVLLCWHSLGSVINNNNSFHHQKTLLS
jgi:hypothetical protein